MIERSSGLSNISSNLTFSGSIFAGRRLSPLAQVLAWGTTRRTRDGRRTNPTFIKMSRADSVVQWSGQPVPLIDGNIRIRTGSRDA